MKKKERQKGSWHRKIEMCRWSRMKERNSTQIEIKKMDEKERKYERKLT